MSREEDQSIVNAFGLGILVGVSLTFILFCLYIASLYDTISDRDDAYKALKQEVINRGHAYYHPQTGKFNWRENEENTSR